MQVALLKIWMVALLKSWMGCTAQKFFMHDIMISFSFCWKVLLKKIVAIDSFPNWNLAKSWFCSAKPFASLYLCMSNFHSSLLSFSSFFFFTLVRTQIFASSSQMDLLRSVFLNLELLCNRPNFFSSFVLSPSWKDY